MVGYLSETAFVGKLSFDIIMWIVILLISFYCIRRYPTDYYTNYRKRNRMSFPKISRQFFDYIPTLVDICSRYIDIFLS